MSSRKERSHRTKSDTGGGSKKTGNSSKKHSSKTGSSSKKHSSKTGNSSKKHSSKRSKKDNQENDEEYLEIYGAIYTPNFGNYYHWALAIFNEPQEDWYIFEVVQDEEGGPFRPEGRQADPLRSQRCRRPLPFLGYLHVDWWEILVEEIGKIQVPGEAVSWNCQDYVLEIWDVMLQRQMIDEETWTHGKAVLLQYYGQDFGSDENEEEADEEEVDEAHGHEFKSEEFIVDSSE